RRSLYVALVLAAHRRHSSFFYSSRSPRHLHSFPTRRSSDLGAASSGGARRSRQAPTSTARCRGACPERADHHPGVAGGAPERGRSEEHTSELQSRVDLVCRLLLEKKKQKTVQRTRPDQDPTT